MKIRIYKMYLEGDESNFYIGSTKNSLHERVLSRRGYIQQRIKAGKSLDKVSTHFKDNLYEICIDLICECECDSKQEQFQIETEYIKQLHPPLNHYCPYASETEIQERNKIRQKVYRERNLEQLQKYDNERNKDRNSVRNMRRRERINCEYCDKEISRGNISTHRNSCKNNPKNTLK